MIADARDIRAVVFDYGNTLIEFAAAQIDYCDGRFGEYLSRTYGPLDRGAFDALRHADRRAPYQGQFRENKLDTICAATVRALYHREPTAEELAAMARLRREAFVECIRAEAEVIALVRRLRQRYATGLLSNYPCSDSIHQSLVSTGLADHLDAVVVSADVGHVKPHPLPFTTVLDRLGVEPARAIYIGDNWLGDVQGAKRIGMKVAYITQYDTPEKFDRQPGDHDPDATITHLRELETLLG